MCLNSISLNLEWNSKEKDFVGYGYKKIPQYNGPVTDSLGRVNYSSVCKLMVNCKNLGNGWWESTGHKQECKVDNTRLTKSSIFQSYYPGFHIFINYNDAVRYKHAHGQIIKVIYKTVTGYGLNETNYEYGPCVIAKYMKIIKGF